MSLDLAASLPAHVSYRLGAVLVSQPDWVFQLADRYSSLTTWRTACHNDNECTFQVIAGFGTKGIEITVSLRDVN